MLFGRTSRGTASARTGRHPRAAGGRDAYGVVVVGAVPPVVGVVAVPPVVPACCGAAVTMRPRRMIVPGFFGFSAVSRVSRTSR